MHEKYGSAPIIWMDEQKRKEWEEVDPVVKKSVFKILHSCADKMEAKMAIEMICNIIVDMDIRLKNLEEKYEPRRD